VRQLLQHIARIARGFQILWKWLLGAALLLGVGVLIALYNPILYGVIASVAWLLSVSWWLGKTAEKKP
jgi:hypothetical protein